MATINITKKTAIQAVGYFAHEGYEAHQGAFRDAVEYLHRIPTISVTYQAIHTSQPKLSSTRRFVVGLTADKRFAIELTNKDDQADISLIRVKHCDYPPDESFIRYFPYSGVPSELVLSSEDLATLTR